MKGERISENLDFQTGISVTSQETDNGPGAVCREENQQVLTRVEWPSLTEQWLVFVKHV